MTSPRLALARSFVITLLVGLTLLGVRAAVSGAAISLPPGGLTKLTAEPFARGAGGRPSSSKTPSGAADAAAPSAIAHSLVKTT